MNRNMKPFYDQGYFAAIKDLRDVIKLLSEQYDKTIPISIIKNELKDMYQRYVGFTNATNTEIE